MNTFILYDTTFGHTGQIALIIGGRLGDYGTVKLFRIHEVDIPRLQDVDLVIIGCPTYQQNLSAAMQAFLERLPSGTFQNLAVATFDTYHQTPARQADLASTHLARKLQYDGAVLLTPPHSFFVSDEVGPLTEQEVRNATRWAEHLYHLFEARQADNNAPAKEMP